MTTFPFAFPATFGETNTSNQVQANTVLLNDLSGIIDSVVSSLLAPWEDLVAGTHTPSGPDAAKNPVSAMDYLMAKNPNFGNATA